MLNVSENTTASDDGLTYYCHTEFRFRDDAGGLLWISGRDGYAYP